MLDGHNPASSLEQEMKDKRHRLQLPGKNIENSRYFFSRGELAFYTCC